MRGRGQYWQSWAPAPILAGGDNGAPRMFAAFRNFVTGLTVANLVSATVGTGGAWDPGGAVDIFNGAGSVQTIADVAGWYAGPSCTISS